MTPTQEVKKVVRKNSNKNSNKNATTENVAQPIEFKIDNSTNGFVFMEAAKEILDISMATGENIILFGPGGYGKSEFTVQWYKENGVEDPYIITMGSGMTTDRLFGGMDLNKFNETGKLEYLVENSFMNNEYVIFEELFDAPDFILEQLKDILSSGIFRNGNQIFHIKTRIIVCCTNKTREEFAKNASLKALMERFPLELEVKWSQHNRVTYEKLLNTKLGFADPMLTFVLEEFAKAGSTISPRIAIKAAKIIAHRGPDALKYIAEFSTKPTVLKDAIAKFKSVFELQEYMMKLEELSKQIDEIDDNDSDAGTRKMSINKIFYGTLSKMKGIKATDEISKQLAEGIKKYNEIYEKNKKVIDLLVNTAL